MVANLNARINGAAAFFTELVELKWDGGAILMRGRSGDYIANGHMSMAFAIDLHMRLGELLDKPSAEVVLLQTGRPLPRGETPKRRKRK